MINGEKIFNEFKQLCTDDLGEGKFDEMIDDSISEILSIVMKASQGKVNPNRVLKRIIKLTEERI